MRGSSLPHNSSGYWSGLGKSVGSRSICQSSTPFTDRAAHRCESPRRSSTRQSSKVEPFGSSVAPALKTLLMEYGQSLPVRIGLAVCRQNSVSYCFVIGFIKIFTALMESISPSLTQARSNALPVKAFSQRRRLFPTYAFPGAPSERTKWTPLPDSRLPGRDASRLDNRRSSDRKERSEDRCLPKTSRTRTTPLCASSPSP